MIHTGHAVCVMIRESRRDCWTMHLDNMGEPKESTEFWWRNVLEKSQLWTHTRKLKDKETKFYDGF